MGSQGFIQGAPLAPRRHLVRLPGLGGGVGHAGHLLLEPAMAGITAGAGRGLCRVRGLGALVVAATARSRGLHPGLRRCRRVVDRHPALARPQLASGSRGDAAHTFIDGERVQITGVRNFEYRSRNDFTVRYEEREVSLSHLSRLDFYVSYWTEGLVGRAA